MFRSPPSFTRTDARFPYPTLFRSGEEAVPQVEALRQQLGLTVRDPATVDGTEAAHVRPQRHGPLVGRRLRVIRLVDPELQHHLLRTADFLGPLLQGREVDGRDLVSFLHCFSPDTTPGRSTQDPSVRK